MVQLTRNRKTYFIIILCTIVVGIFLRSQSNIFPDLINLYLGDIFYALTVHLGAGFLFIRQSSYKNAIIALAFCFIVEISQFYHEPWIDEIRNNRVGGLILGFGFLWSDLLSYTIGVSIGVLFEKWWLRNTPL